MDEKQLRIDLADAMSLEPEEITDEREIEWDSLLVVSCVSIFDEQFGFVPEGKALRGLKTVGDLLAYGKANAKNG